MDPAEENRRRSAAMTTGYRFLFGGTGADPEPADPTPVDHPDRQRPPNPPK